MSLPVRRSRRAEADLDAIWLSVAKDNVAAAEAFADRLEAAEDRLGQDPELGQARAELGDGVRQWPPPPYLILYRVEPDCVLILRILHAGRDLPTMIRD